MLCGRTPCPASRDTRSGSGSMRWPVPGWRWPGCSRATHKSSGPANSAAKSPAARAESRHSAPPPPGGIGRRYRAVRYREAVRGPPRAPIGSASSNPGRKGRKEKRSEEKKLGPLIPNRDWPPAPPCCPAAAFAGQRQRIPLARCPRSPRIPSRSISPRGSPCDEAVPVEAVNVSMRSIDLHRSPRHHQRVGPLVNFDAHIHGGVGD